MATLADLVYAASRRFSYVIKVNGVTLTPGTQAVALAELTGIPGVVGFGWDEATAHIDVNRCPNWMRAGMSVTIDAGFNDLNMRVFTGFVVALPGEDPDYIRDKIIVRGTTIQVGTPPDDVPVEQKASATLVGADIQPPLPSGTYIEHEISAPLVSSPTRLAQIAIRELGRYGVVPRRPSGDPSRQTILCGGELYKAARSYQLDDISLDGFTDRDAMALICDLVGITKRTFIEPPEGWYTLDVGAKVRRGRPLDMLAQLMVIGGLEAYHSEDGTLIFRQVEFAPGPAHAWEYNVQAQALARIISATGEMEVTFNPFVRKFSTGLLNIPYLGFNSSRVFTRRVRHEVTSDGPKTYIDAWGGSRLGGTLAQNPFASFTFHVEREVFGPATFMIYSADARTSFDPDGTTVTYAWTCNRTTIPASLGTARTTTFRVPITVAAPLELTLTVTDAGGLTSTQTVTLPITTADEEMQIPAIYAAINNRHSASLDGAINWNDSTVASGNSISVGARPADGVNVGHACYGTSTGRIYRTTDGGVTATLVYTSAAAVAINDVQWDWRSPLVVWAVDENAIVYISLDAGVTWTIYASLRTKLSVAGALGNKLGLPGAGGVYVFGGTGAGSPLIAYDPVVGSQGWVNVAFTGDLLTDTVTTPADATMRIIDYTAPGFASGVESMILAWASGGGASITAVYTTTAAPGSSRAFSRASTTFGALKTGRWIAGDNPQNEATALYCAFANRSIWSSTDGIAWTETANVMPVGVTPWHALQMSDVLTGMAGFFGIFFIAASDGLYKWMTGDATASYIRGGDAAATAWPASAIGKKLSLGAQGQTTGTGRVLALLANDTARYLTNPSWSAALAITGANVGNARPFCLTPTNWFATDISGTGAGDTAYSKDGGATWAALPAAVQRAIWFCRDAVGRIWALNFETNTGQSIYYSDNNGDSWTASQTATGANTHSPLMIAAHPTNPNILFVVTTNSIGGAQTYATIDRGVTWTATAGGTRPKAGQAGLPYLYGATVLANGRFLAAGPLAAGLNWDVMYSDDQGVTWTATASAVAHYTSNTIFLLPTSHWVPSTKLAIAKQSKTASPYITTMLISDDSGKTWTAITPSQSLGSYIGNVTAVIKGQAYDPANDAMYISTGESGFAVVKFAPLTADGVWTNLTLNLGSPNFDNGNLAVIP